MTDIEPHRTTTPADSRQTDSNNYLIISDFLSQSLSQTTELFAGLRRQQEAKHILEETSKSSKKQTCSTSLLKFRTLFEKDLAWAASAGYCSYRMYITLRGLACMIEPDVQPSERLNKALTLFGDRCPSGTLDLRTGRAAMKHFLGAYSISSTKRYKDMKPAAKALMAECLKGWALLDEVDSNENRFQHAEKRNDLPSLEQAKKNAPKPRMTVDRIWAATMNGKLGKQRSKRAYACSHGLPCISFVIPPKKATEAPLVFLVTDKVRTALHLVSCRQIADNCGRYMLRTPMTFSRSHDVFSRFFKLVRQGVTISVVEFMVNVNEDSWQTLAQCFPLLFPLPQNCDDRANCVCLFV